MSFPRDFVLKIVLQHGHLISLVSKNNPQWLHRFWPLLSFTVTHSGTFQINAYSFTRSSHGIIWCKLDITNQTTMWSIALWVGYGWKLIVIVSLVSVVLQSLPNDVLISASKRCFKNKDPFSWRSWCTLKVTLPSVASMLHLPYPHKSK